MRGSWKKTYEEALHESGMYRDMNTREYMRRNRESAAGILRRGPYMEGSDAPPVDMRAESRKESYYEWLLAELQKRSDRAANSSSARSESDDRRRSRENGRAERELAARLFPESAFKEDDSLHGFAAREILNKLNLPRTHEGWVEMNRFLEDPDNMTKLLGRERVDTLYGNVPAGGLAVKNEILNLMWNQMPESERDKGSEWEEFTLDNLSPEAFNFLCDFACLCYPPGTVPIKIGQSLLMDWWAHDQKYKALQRKNPELTFRQYAASLPPEEYVKIAAHAALGGGTANVAWNLGYQNGLINNPVSQSWLGMHAGNMLNEAADKIVDEGFNAVRDGIAAAKNIADESQRRNRDFAEERMRGPMATNYGGKFPGDDDFSRR